MKAQIESKWTAGKWKLAVGVIEPDKVWCEDESGNEVLIARGIDNPADANLIAQAPAMLEALELALCYMEADGDDEQEREDYDRIKSIIARVKGEQP